MNHEQQSLRSDQSPSEYCSPSRGCGGPRIQHLWKSGHVHDFALSVGGRINFLHYRSNFLSYDSKSLHHRATSFITWATFSTIGAIYFITGAQTSSFLLQYVLTGTTSFVMGSNLLDREQLSCLRGQYFIYYDILEHPSLLLKQLSWLLEHFCVLQEQLSSLRQHLTLLAEH